MFGPPSRSPIPGVLLRGNLCATSPSIHGRQIVADPAVQKLSAAHANFQKTPSILLESTRDPWRPLVYSRRVLYFYTVDPGFQNISTREDKIPKSRSFCRNPPAATFAKYTPSPLPAAHLRAHVALAVSPPLIPLSPCLSHSRHCRRCLPLFLLSLAAAAQHPCPRLSPLPSRLLVLSTPLWVDHIVEGRTGTRQRQVVEESYQDLRSCPSGL